MSVVICAYTEDRWSDLLRAIDSALMQEPPPDDVVVVIDHNEALRHRLEAAAATRVRVIPSDRPVGLSGARNAGVAASTGEFVVFLDDDARARPGWLRELAAAFDRDVIGVGGLVLPDWEGGRPAWFPEEFDWVVGCSYLGLPTKVAEVRNVIGASMAFRRSALDAAGAFDSGLGRVGSRPTGAEETELSIRARAAIPGTRIVFTPRAVVDHHVSRSRARLGYFLARCFGEGRSKAILLDLAPSTERLRPERQYTRSVLPRGVARELRALMRGNLGGARCAAAIVLGLAATVLGFVWGRVALALTPPRAQPFGDRR